MNVKAASPPITLSGRTRWSRSLKIFGWNFGRLKLAILGWSYISGILATEEGTVKAGSVIWLTGLPCSGKSTLAHLLHASLKAQGVPSELFDGDIVRQHLTKGLGFSKEDRIENVRRIAYVAHLLSKNGVVSIVAAISPYQEARDEIRKELERYVEIFVDCPVEVCQARDVKGMYKKAREGRIPHFTGVSDPYEVPIAPDLVVHTSVEPQQESLARIIKFLAQEGHVGL